jgi:hypothetical protein
MVENSNDQVTVSVIGGGASAPSAAATQIPSGTVAKTAAGLPNVLVNVVPRFTAILVRGTSS